MTAVMMLAGAIWSHTAVVNDIILLVGIFLFVAVVVFFLLYLHYYFQKQQRYKHEIVDRLLGSSNIMVLIWQQSYVTPKTNAFFRQLTGYTEEELSLPETWKNLFSDEILVRFRVATEENREIANVQLPFTDKKGNAKMTVWSMSAQTEGNLRHKRKPGVFLIIGFDTTDFSEMQSELMDYSKRLEFSQKRYELSNELYEIGVILFSPDDSHCYVSNAGHRMLGLERQVVSISDIFDRLHPDDMEMYKLLEAAANNENVPESTLELRMMASDRTYHWYILRYKSVRMNQTGEHALGGAFMDITKEKEKDLLIEKMAYIDEVTGVFNRNRFISIGQTIFSYCVKTAEPYYLINIDLDKFQLLNDTYGFEAGNTVLRILAGIITSTVEVDSVCARIGGDNFAVLFKDNGISNYPQMLVKIVQTKLNETKFDFAVSLLLSISAGFSKMPDDGNDFSEIFERAEFALRTAKNSNERIRKYDNSVRKAVVKQNEVEAKMSKAIDEQQFVLYYQPKTDLINGQLVGMEALIRWELPSGEIIPPSEFIPIAERSQLIIRISKFVLYEACRQNKQWQDEGMPPVIVSVNLTATDFYQTDVCETIKETLEETGLQPQWLEIELTESLALRNVEQAIAQMERIKQLGVKISMDDFGTGYSSLSYIQLLPIDVLKLDRSFIMNLATDKVSSEIVAAVIRIAKSKCIKTIAEGVETEGQAEILRNTGCDYAQGYYFGRPTPSRDFVRFLSEIE